MATTLATREAANEAHAAALRNFSANLRALAEVQPDVVAGVRRPEGEWEWVFGRDGALTALSQDGLWLAGCSLPTRAADAMLTNVELRGTCACLLAPNHAALVRRALDLLGPEQGLIVVTPDESFLAAALHCDDFSREIEAHRLFLCAGPGWAERLTDLFRAHPGLPTPALFLRPATTPDTVAQTLIEGTQKVFGETNKHHSESLAALAARPAPRPTKIARVCAVAPSAFRLWADFGTQLADLLSADGSVDIPRFDTDRPTTASHLALATAAADCDALVAANLGRADVASNVFPADRPWLTWCTTDVIPNGHRAGVRDRLILADPACKAAALAAGWRETQIGLATWPAVTLPKSSEPAAITLITNTVPIRTDINEDTFDLSSHMVLWELIASELRADPLLAAEDPAAYLTSRMNRLSIAPEGFNRALFLEHLVLPAYHQGVVRLLTSAGLPVRTFGRGWSDIPEFAPHTGGPLRSRGDLLRAAASASALVRPAPATRPHPVDAFPQPIVVPAATGGAAAFVQRAKVAHSGTARHATPPTPPLSAASVMTLLRDAISA